MKKSHQFSTFPIFLEGLLKNETAIVLKSESDKLPFGIL